MKKLILLLSFLAVLSGCSNRLYLSADFDKEADFGTYSTFSMAPDLEKAGKGYPMFDNELNRRRIKDAIISEMKLKGLTYTDTDPDLLVDFHISIESSSMEYIVHDYHPARFRYWTTSNLTSYTVKKGALIIHLTDEETSQLIWQGVGSKNLSEVAPIDMEAKITETVKAILKRYPPQNE